MQKILLTGASGFLGKEVLNILKTENYNVTPICSNNNQLPNHLSIDLEDSLQLIRLLNQEKPSVIINLASKVSFDSMINELFAINILCPGIIANYCAKNGCHLLQASSISVNGNNQSVYDNKTPLKQDDDYGRSKFAAEKLILDSGCEYSIIRFGGIFGKNGPTHLGINKTIKDAFNNKIPTIYNSGNPKRNYIYVIDAAKAIIKCVEEKLTGIHYLGGENKTVKSMVSDICELFFPGKIPNVVKGKSSKDQIIHSSTSFKITPFRTAIEQML